MTSSSARFLLLIGCFILPPFARGKDWPNSPPEAQGVRSDDLRQLSEWVRAEELDIRSMILVKNGICIFEWYAGGVTRDDNHNVFSITKSMIATLAGIAIREGKLSGPGARLGDIVTGIGSSAASQVSLRDLMTMRSGFPVSRGNQPGPKRRLFNRWHTAPDRMSLVRELAPVKESGREFAYNNIDPQLVLSMVESAYGKSALPLAREKLFDPLEFNSVEWVYADPGGNLPGGYGLRLRAMDLAKLGQLYLNGGSWNGVRLLSEAFVREATSDQTEKGYGYFWWVPGEGQLAAKGVRGQQIWVDRRLGVVFVVTADLAPRLVRDTLKTLTDRILSAMPEKIDLGDSRSFEALRDELRIAGRYLPPNRKGLPGSRLPRTPM